MKKYLVTIVEKIPVLKLVSLTRRCQTPVKLQHLFQYFVNPKLYWPVHSSSLVSQPEKIVIGIDVSPGYMPGCYIQGGGGILIGDYTQISCNVGLISKNHDPLDISNHLDSEFPSIVIGKYCWVGMNATILPGVKIADYCIVGAGSVVTKSVEISGSIVAGNPAKTIRVIDIKDIKEFRSENEYVGFIPVDKFNNYRRKNLRL